MASRPRQPRRDARSADSLDRDQLVQAALQLIEEHGAEGFSMRGLATALGVRSPSLYWHVESKQQLLDLVVDHVLGKCQPPDPLVAQWPDALAQFTRQVRETILHHPGVAQLLVGRIPTGPNGLRLADACLALLHHAGFDKKSATDAYMILVFYATGFAIQEITFGRGPEARRRLTQLGNTLATLPAHNYPHLADAAHDYAAPGRLNHRFELGLADLISGLQQRAPTREGQASRTG